ncbi:hypothetical protein HKD37_20G055651 [Glycine soja]
MERVMMGHLGDCAKGAKDSEVDVTLASNAKNELLDVHTRVHIDDDDPHKWLTGLGHKEGNGLLLVLGAWWPAMSLLRRWGWEKEILLGLEEFWVWEIAKELFVIVTQRCMELEKDKEM